MPLPRSCRHKPFAGLAWRGDIFNMNPFFDNSADAAVDFDYSAIDEHERGERGNSLIAEIERPAEQHAGALALGRAFGMLLTYGGTDARSFFITANVLAFASGFHPNQKAPAENIAAGLQMRKAAFLRRVNIMRRILISRETSLPRITGQWSDAARKSIKYKITETHEKRINGTNGHKPNGFDTYMRPAARARGGN